MPFSSFTMSLGAVDLPSPPPSPSQDPLLDVFDGSNNTATTKSPNSHPSSITKLQRVHFNDGYREGVSTSKGTHVQDGFDEGYPLGAELALRVGVILGSLEELCAAMNQLVKKSRTERGDRADIVRETSGAREGDVTAAPSSSLTQKTASQEAPLQGWESQREVVNSLLKSAEEELALQSVFSKDYFDEEGIWKWNIGDHAGSMSATECIAESTDSHGPIRETAVDTPQATFREVANAHPLLTKWRGIANGKLQEFGLVGAELSWTNNEDEQANKSQNSGQVHNHEGTQAVVEDL